MIARFQFDDQSASTLLGTTATVLVLRLGYRRCGDANRLGSGALGPNTVVSALHPAVPLSFGVLSSRLLFVGTKLINARVGLQTISRSH